jgi:hypothetical protein
LHNGSIRGGYMYQLSSGFIAKLGVSIPDGHSKYYCIETR